MRYHVHTHQSGPDKGRYYILDSIPETPVPDLCFGVRSQAELAAKRLNDEAMAEAKSFLGYDERTEPARQDFLAGGGTRLTMDLGDGPVEYGLLDTTAPADYDGFGTLVLAQFGDLRVVLQPLQHLAWYQQRCASGGYRCDVSTGYSQGAITGALGAALRDGLAKNR